MVAVSDIMLTLVPLAFSFFVANFGAKIADVIRVFCVYNAATAPVILPSLFPWITTGSIDITVPFVTNIVAGIFAGFTAVYTSVKRRGFGIRVQGMAWGFMVSAFTTPLYTALIRRHAPELADTVMPWTVFTLSVAQGHAIGELYGRFKSVMVAIFSSIMGAYASLLVVASLGLPFTEGLSLGGMFQDPRQAALAGGASDGSQGLPDVNLDGFDSTSPEVDGSRSGTLGGAAYGGGVARPHPNGISMSNVCFIAFPSDSVFHLILFFPSFFFEIHHTNVSSLLVFLE